MLESCTACQILAPQTLQFADGTLREVQKDRWIVYKGSMPIQDYSETEFRRLYDHVETGLVVKPATCAQIEERLGIGAMQSTGALLQAIDRLARIRVGDISLTFTPGQLEELQHRAKKRGLPLEEYLARLLQRFTSEIWSLGV